jgi:mercuric ion transport protein
MLDAKESHGRSKMLIPLGAVTAAVAASACCLGPLLLALLGAGGAGAFVALGAYRPYLLAFTAALLSSGFYLTYRRPRRVATVGLGEGDACGCERPKANRAGRFGLWLATVLVVVFAAAPPLLAGIAERESRGAAAQAAGAELETAIVHVQGIDCEACAAPLRRALTKVGGLRDLALDVPAQNARITYEPAPSRLQAYVAAINDLGYDASLPRLEPSPTRGPVTRPR